MKKLLVAACALFIVGCEDMGGTFDVQKAFQANTEDGAKTIASGTYDTSLNFKKREVIVTLKTKEVAAKFSIQIPKGTQIPDNGSFALTAAQAGQPFDIAGTNKAVESHTDERSEVTSCEYTRYENYCTPQGCFTRPVTVWGQQTTWYYLSTVNRDMSLNIIASGATAAHFTGASSYTTKVITHQTQCW